MRQTILAGRNYVMLALRAQLRQSNWFEENAIAEPNLAELLDLVALGTVADVVPLDHNNRILIAQGLARIRAGHCCAGMKALVQIAGRQLNRLGAQDLAFAELFEERVVRHSPCRECGVWCCQEHNATRALESPVRSGTYGSIHCAGRVLVLPRYI